MDNKELIWVEKEFADKYNAMNGDSANDENRLRMFDEYIETVCAKSKSDFKANLECMEEDAAIYSGLMLKVKQAFEKAKNEALTSSYALWEEYDKELPNVTKKIAGITAALEPLETKLKDINDLFGKIRTFNIDKLAESIENVSNLYGKNKDMVQFLVTNFKD